MKQNKEKLTVTKAIGLIVEDESDFFSMKNFINRIIYTKGVKMHKMLGNGCGKIVKKSAKWAELLHEKGCNVIIIVHDLDRKELKKLRTELEKTLTNSPATYNFVCIPVEEMEAWFLSDPEEIKNFFSLKRLPKINGNPETIKSPKEYLEDIVYDCSEKTKIYINTKHNEKLSDIISIEKILDKCPSFRTFYDFILEVEF